MEIKHLDEKGLKKVFDIVSQKDKELENDITLVLNGIAQELENKADKSDIPEISDTVVNADWDAEEGESGYIKNKPFGEIGGEMFYESLEDKTTLRSSTSSFDKYNINLYVIGQSMTLGAFINAGEEYIIEIEGKRFNVIAKQFTDKAESRYLTNYDGDLSTKESNTLWGDFIWSSYQGDLITSINLTNSKNNITWRIYKSNEIKQLDPKYLPIVQETGDSETSIMSQKAVTEALANVGGGESVRLYPKNNQFFYFSIDGSKLELSSNSYYQDVVETIVSNEYNDYGIITFKDDITVLPAIYKIFEEYKNIIELVLPNCITDFSESQFQSMENLCKVNIPTNLTSLSRWCFQSCYSLYEIRLPNHIKEIPASCFYDCYSLSSINLDNIETINNNAFYECRSLTSVSLCNILTFNGSYQFNGCISLSNLVFVNQYNQCKLTSIPDGCFQDHNIKNIEIPSSITSIGLGAFYTNKRIETVVLNPDILFDLNRIFSSQYDRIKYYVNYTMIEEYRNKYPYYWGNFFNMGYDYYTLVYKNQLWTGTQEEYDAIQTKDSNTFYFIKEDE